MKGRPFYNQVASRGLGSRLCGRNKKPTQKYQPHAPTHYEPSGFGLLGPLLPSLRAANFGTASPC